MERSPDVLVVGGGLIGLSCALALTDRGLRVRVIDGESAGAASAAAAGLLAPSIDPADGPAQRFAIAGRDRFPEFARVLRERSGCTVTLGTEGVLQVALSERGERGLRRAMPSTAVWLDRDELGRVEPALGHAVGAVLHPLDGFVNNVELLTALRSTLALSPDASTRTGFVRTIELSVSGATAVTSDGERLHAGLLVLAAGAWAAGLDGLPRPLLIEPVRGQVVAFDGCSLGRPAFGPTGYVVPRAPGRLLVGSTVEHAGFDAGTTSEGAGRLRSTAAELIPSLTGRQPAAHWSGLRPMTPDGQPIIGRDPAQETLIYACGHSRNGILGTSVTGEVVAALAVGGDPLFDLTPFAPTRFEAMTTL